MSVLHVLLPEVVSINPPPDNGFRPRAAALVEAARVNPAVLDVHANSEANNQLQSSFGYVKAGDVLLKRMLVKFAAGAVCQLQVALPWAYHRGTLVALRADPQRLNSRYLLHFLRSYQMGSHIDHWRASQSNSKPPLMAFLRQLLMPLPSLAQQAERVAQLEQMQAQCKRLEAHLAELNQQRRLLFEQFFGSPQEMQKRYRAAALPSLLHGYCMGTGLASGRDDGLLLVLPTNLGVNRFCIAPENHLNLRGQRLPFGRMQVKWGDVLLDTRCTTVQTAVANADVLSAYIGKDVAVLRPKHAEAGFLAGYLASGCAKLEFERLIRGRRTSNLKRCDLSELPVYLPPIDQQKAYVAAINTPCPEIETTEREWWQCRETLLKLELQAFGG